MGHNTDRSTDAALGGVVRGRKAFKRVSGTATSAPYTGRRGGRLGGAVRVGLRNVAAARYDYTGGIAHVE